MNTNCNNYMSLVPVQANQNIPEESKKSKRNQQEELPKEFENLKKMKFTTEEMEPDFSAAVSDSESPIDFTHLLNSNAKSESPSLFDALNENPNVLENARRIKHLEQEIHALYDEATASKNRDIASLELENTLLTKENQFLSNYLEGINKNKKLLIDQFNNIQTPYEYEHFLTVMKNSQIYTTLWKEILSEGKVKEESLTFITNDENTITLTFPVSIWKLYGEVFGIAAAASMMKTPFIEHVSGESFQLFLKCLQTGNSLSIDVDHLDEIWELANKYQIPWLIKDCRDDFENIYKPLKKFAEEVEFLRAAAKFQHGTSAQSSIISLCKLLKGLDDFIDIKDNGCVRNALKDLEDQFADLKLFLTDLKKVTILPDGSFSVSYENDLLLPCLAIKNSWYSPQIEIDIRGQLDEKTAAHLNEILDGANTSITLCLDRIAEEINIIDFLQNNPKIQKLRININCECPAWYDDKKLLMLELIEKNTTLTSLHLTLNNYDSGQDENNNTKWNWPGVNEYLALNRGVIWPLEEGASFAIDQIFLALKKNKIFREEKDIPPIHFIGVQSNREIDTLSTYTDKPYVGITDDFVGVDHIPSKSVYLRHYNSDCIY